MITSETKPLLVTSARRKTGVIHFASGDARVRTVPYCQSQWGKGVRRTGPELEAFAAGFDVLDPATGALMNCDNCAELIAKYPSWRPNHFPLMISDLRWI